MKIPLKISLLIVLTSICIILIGSNGFFKKTKQNYDRCLEMKKRYSDLNCNMIRTSGEEIISIFNQLDSIEKNEFANKNTTSNDKEKAIYNEEVSEETSKIMKETKKDERKQKENPDLSSSSLYIRQDLYSFNVKVENDEYDSSEFIRKMNLLKNKVNSNKKREK